MLLSRHSVVSDSIDCSLPGFSVRGISPSKYWSGLSVPSPGYLPDSGTEPTPPARLLRCRSFFPAEPSGKPNDRTLRAHRNNLPLQLLPPLTTLGLVLRNTGLLLISCAQHAFARFVCFSSCSFCRCAPIPPLYTLLTHLKIQHRHYFFGEASSEHSSAPPQRYHHILFF